MIAVENNLITVSFECRDAGAERAPMDTEPDITLAHQPMIALRHENSVRYCWNH
jgi:hypothetical protein